MIIRKLREQIGLNQSQLAKLSGLDQTTISKIESGQRRKVHADTLGAIAKALKTSTVLPCTLQERHWQMWAQ